MKSILVFDELKKRVSLSARRVWIEIHVLSDTSVSITSLSARRVWIEIAQGAGERRPASVTLREEGVD